MGRVKLKVIKSGKNEGIYLIGRMSEKQKKRFSLVRSANDGYVEYPSLKGVRAGEEVISIGGFGGLSIKLQHARKLMEKLNRV